MFRGMGGCVSKIFFLWPAVGKKILTFRKILEFWRFLYIVIAYGF